MSLNYIGPPALRQTLEAIYDRISGDYERKNPTVIVGLPHPINSILDKTDAIGFESQEEFDRFADKRIRQLVSMVEGGIRSSAAKGKIRRLLEELERCSFVLRNDIFRNKNGKTLAFYSPTDDAIFLDTYYSAAFRATGMSMGAVSSETRNIQNQFRHEMVHFDLGLTLVDAEIRKYMAQAVDFANWWHEGHEMVLRNKKEFIEWIKRGGGKGLYDSLMASQGDYSLEATKREVGRLTGLADSLDARKRELRIDVGHEALAYNYDGNKDVFLEWSVLEHGSGARTDALMIYGLFRRMIERCGKIGAKKKVEQATDRSFMEGEDFFHYFPEV